MASISWTDTEGAATLENGFPAPGNRFNKWKPLVNGVTGGAGVQAVGMGTGITYAYRLRTAGADYGASFQMTYIPNASQALLSRLKDWLEGGGVVTVATADTAAHTYTLCYLWPGSSVEISEPDPLDLRYTVTLAVLNSEGTRMVCQY